MDKTIAIPYHLHYYSCKCYPSKMRTWQLLYYHPNLVTILYLPLPSLLLVYEILYTWYYLLYYGYNTINASVIETPVTLLYNMYYTCVCTFLTAAMGLLQHLRGESCQKDREAALQWMKRSSEAGCIYGTGVLAHHCILQQAIHKGSGNCSQVCSHMSVCLRLSFTVCR